MTCSIVWHLEQDAGSLSGTLYFREVVIEGSRFSNLLDIGVIESNPLSKYTEQGIIMALIVPRITQVGDYRNQLIMGRGR
jgi:hypothetical protein